MAEVVYTVSPAICDQVREAISKPSLPMPRKSSGQYDNDNIITLQKWISWVLGTQYNPGAPWQGTKQLLDAGDNSLTSVKSTDVITIKSITKAFKAVANALAPRAKPACCA